jgi:hypothetical protein
MLFPLRLQPDLDQRACSENRYASAPGSSDYRYNFSAGRRAALAELLIIARRGAAENFPPL